MMFTQSGANKALDRQGVQVTWGTYVGDRGVEPSFSACHSVPVPGNWTVRWGIVLAAWGIKANAGALLSSSTNRAGNCASGDTTRG
jgi:hypothetical protein